MRQIEGFEAIFARQKSLILLKLKIKPLYTNTEAGIKLFFAKKNISSF